MATQAQAVVLTKRYQAVLAQISARTAAAMSHTWDKLGSWDDDDVDEFAAKTAPVLAGAKSAATSSTLGYLQVLLGGPTPNVDPRAFADSVDVRSPFLGYWGSLGRGEPWTDAITTGRSYAETLAVTSVQSAARGTSAEVDAQESRIVGWERVLVGASCEWCALVATQRYHTAESANFGHNNCDCTVVPIIGSVAPGRVINGDLRDALNNQDEPTGYVNPDGSTAPRPGDAPPTVGEPPVGESPDSRPSYPEGLSAREAEQWMGDTWGVTEGGEGRQFFLSGLGNEAANETASTLNDLFAEFPKTAERIKITGAAAPVTAVVNDMGVGRMPRMSNRAYADTSRQVGSIRVSGGFKKPELAVKLANDAKSGYHPPGTGNLASVVRHEFGHNLYWQAQEAASASGLRVQMGDELQAVMERHVGVTEYDNAAGYFRGRYTAIKDEVSRYATTNDDELMAEAFSYVLAGDASPLATELIGVLVKYAEGA